MNGHSLNFDGIFRPVLVIHFQVFKGVQRFKPINDSVNTNQANESEILQCNTKNSVRRTWQTQCTFHPNAVALHM